MSKKPRYFVIVSHCLLNPATRVHLLGRRFQMVRKIVDFLLSKNISIIQLPCPEFTAMGYWRNPQGRMQYDNVFFRKHCRKELESYVDMICELKNNDNTPLCFIGIQGSPNCSIKWGKHKINKYKTESMMEEKSEENDNDINTEYGVMTQVLDDMLAENGIKIPYLEAPVKENIKSEVSMDFYNKLYEVLNISQEYRDIQFFLND